MNQTKTKANINLDYEIKFRKKLNIWRIAYNRTIFLCASMSSACGWSLNFNFVFFYLKKYLTYFTFVCFEKCHIKCQLQNLILTFFSEIYYSHQCTQVRVKDKFCWMDSGHIFFFHYIFFETNLTIYYFSKINFYVKPMQCAKIKFLC